jgi:glycosyl transferase family 87
VPKPLRHRLELGPTQRVVWFCRSIIAAALLSLVFATLVGELQILRTSNIPPAYPPVLYLLMPSPGTSPEAGAPGAAGGDFSQVYTSALALRHGESAYFPKTAAFADRFGRPAGYPPLMNWLGVPLTLLPYHAALLLHVGASLALLLATTAFILASMSLRRHIPRTLLAQASLYLLTPVGFTHLERGQFDLIVAAASALAVGSTFLPRGALGSALASGFLGALKWTSAPFLGCFSAFTFALCTGRRRWSALGLLAVMAIGTAVFWRELGEYWYAIRVFEIDAEPRGISLQHYLPRPVVKLLPVVVTAAISGLALWRARAEPQREVLLLALSAPFSMLLLGLAACYATTSYEYHSVALLGAIPGLVVWLERDSAVPPRIKLLVTVGFALFLCVAFRTFQLAPPFNSSWMTRNYIVFNLAMFIICSGIVMRAALPRLDEHRGKPAPR